LCSHIIGWKKRDGRFAAKTQKNIPKLYLSKKNLRVGNILFSKQKWRVIYFVSNIFMKHFWRIA